jgi:hypothetical protein
MNFAPITILFFLCLFRVRHEEVPIGCLNYPSLTAIESPYLIHCATSVPCTSNLDCYHIHFTFSGCDMMNCWKDVGVLGGTGSPPLVPVMCHWWLAHILVRCTWSGSFSTVEEKTKRIKHIETLQSFVNTLNLGYEQRPGHCKCPIKNDGDYGYCSFTDGHAKLIEEQLAPIIEKALTLQEFCKGRLNELHLERLYIDCNKHVNTKVMGYP